MKKRTLNELRQEKEFGYKPPVDKKTKPKQDFEIKITITDGEKKSKGKINLNDYKFALVSNGVSLVDEMIDVLLKEIDKTVITNIKTMTNTQSHAQKELEILVKTTPDAIIRDFVPELLALCEKFGNSGQSGGSAPYTAKALSMAVEKLCLQKSICPITGVDEEWNDITRMNNGELMYQNNRDSRIFKDGKEGQAYFIEAIVFDGDIGGRFTGNGSVSLNGVNIGSTHNIKSFPFEPKTFYVDVIDHRFKDKEEKQPDVNGDWWTHSLKDETQLKEVFNYYDQRFS